MNPKGTNDEDQVDSRQNASSAEVWWLIKVKFPKSPPHQSLVSTRGTIRMIDGAYIERFDEVKFVRTRRSVKYI